MDEQCARSRLAVLLSSCIRAAIQDVNNSMKIFVGFDDTDVLGAPIGTGRLVRMYEEKLPPEARLWGVLRHQLLVDDRIPYTSHNSPACAVVEADAALVPRLIELAVQHIAELASPGSDPGLCVARDDADLSRVIEFARACTRSVRTQQEAKTIAAEAGVHLSGHGGTNDGIIGAAAAVGLSACGWSGRFLEYGGGLRELPDPISVAELQARGIYPVPLDHNATVLSPDTLITTKGWPRPRFWAGQAILPVQYQYGHWVALGKERRPFAHMCKAARLIWTKTHRAFGGPEIAGQKHGDGTGDRKHGKGTGGRH